jgi:thioredoxin reductase
VVQSAKGEYRGARVVLAIGKRGSPRKLGVPGEDSSKVAYNLLDAEAYRGKAICIVGGGDSGIEASCGLARADLQNRVSIVHRTEDFGRAKPRNQKKIGKAMDEGRVRAFFNAALTRIRENSVTVKTPAGLEEIDNDYVFVMAGGENPKKFLTECGIEFSQRPLG